MSEIGNKIKAIFGQIAVYKNPENYQVFTGRNLPSFVKDYLISSHIGADGKLNREALSHFLDAHIPADNNAVRARLLRGETLTLLTRFIVSTNISRNMTHFQIPDMGIKASDTQIPYYLIEQFPDDLIDGEKWGILKIVYIPPEEGRSGGYIEMAAFKPFRPMQRLDMNAFRKCREQFTLEEWVDVLISAMEYTPSAFAGMTQKLEFLTRLLPFIEPRLNMIELAPKGTGKSYVFGNLSKFVWLISGGKVSRAKLFYNKSTQQPGIMRFYDTVALDEIQTISFTDGTDMQSLLKSYLEFGRAQVDNYAFMSECGMMLLGNIELTENRRPMSERYFDELPINFKESALLDRFHGFIEGWLLPRVNNDMALRDWTINVEFFSEVLHQMRTATEYSNIVNKLIYVPEKADMRHLNAVRKVATAYMKLLFPHITNVDDMDKNLFQMYCLDPAVHRRDIIREQCSFIDRENSFSTPMPAFRVV